MCGEAASDRAVSHFTGGHEVNPGGFREDMLSYPLSTAPDLVWPERVHAAPAIGRSDTQTRLVATSGDRAGVMA